MRIGIKCGPTVDSFEAFDLETGKVIPTIKCSIDDISVDKPLLTATLRIPLESLELSHVSAVIEAQPSHDSTAAGLANDGFVRGGAIGAKSATQTFTADESVTSVRRGPDGNLEAAPNE